MIMKFLIFLIFFLNYFCFDIENKSVIYNKNIPKGIDCSTCMDSTALLKTKIIKEDVIKVSFVYHFLLCFSSSCKNNVELSEYSNEVLLLLLKEYPELSLKTFSKYRKKIQWDYICTEIAKPVNDSINPNEILKKIETIYGYDDVKKDVINALKIACSRL